MQRNLPASTRAAHRPDNSEPSATPQTRDGRGTFQKNLGGALPGGAEAQNGGRGEGGGWSRGAKWRPRGGAHAPPYRTQPLRGLVCTRGSGCPAPQRRHGTEPEGWVPGPRQPAVPRPGWGGGKAPSGRLRQPLRRREARGRSCTGARQRPARPGPCDTDGRVRRARGWRAEKSLFIEKVAS